MLKYAALLFNTIALLICQFFFVEDVKITQNMPASAKPDSEFIVELTINKGAMTGFAKLQQFIPQGLKAVPIEMKGGDFKFVDQQVKIIWMSLPSDKEFKISYKVIVDAGVGGDKKIGGKFSYVVDNVKQEVLVPESTISILSSAAEQPVATETKPPAETKVEEKTPETVVVKTEEKTPETTPEVKTETPKTETTPTTDATTAKSVTTQDAAGVVCTRKTPDHIVYSKTNTSNDFIVEIKINKGNLSGFAKLLETLPAGFVATAMESASATFSFADQKVKYVWVSVPAQTEFQVSYKVSVPDGVTGNINIDGVFSYIENDETKKAIITTSTIIIDNGSAITSTETPKTTEPVATTETPKTSETPKTAETTTSTTTEQPKEVVKTASDTENTTSGLSTTPSAQTNVSYRVQIAALHNAMNATKLAARFNISQSVVTEMADGFTKYTVGAHTEYKSARDSREEIKNKGVVGPFVTAYNTGKRITVQEALMITSQKWYK